MIKNGMRAVHPGEILFEEFMYPGKDSRYLFCASRRESFS